MGGGGCNFTKPINKVYVSLQLVYFTETDWTSLKVNFYVAVKDFVGGNFREIIKYDKLEGCFFLNELFDHKLLVPEVFYETVAWANRTLQGIAHKCPYYVSFLRYLSSVFKEFSYMLEHKT